MHDFPTTSTCAPMPSQVQPSPQDRFVERGLASMAALKRGAPTLLLEESMQNLRRRIERARRRVTSASVPTARDSVG
jgi:hypothetical protein